MISKLIPASEWLRSYGRRELYGDFSSALVITVLLVPQSMAYALLAGLPPIYGLYASTVPTIVYALFGSSRHMPVGPPALMALLTFTSVSALAEPGTGRYIGFALLLAAMVGVIQLALGLARLGFITNFISHPVLSGFIYASAIVIAISQAEGLLGVSLPEGVSTLRSVVALVGVVDQANLVTLALGLTSLLLILILERASTRLPGSLFVVVAATVVVYVLGLGQEGVNIVGEVPAGLPSLSLPALDGAALRTLLPAAFIVAFVGFIESISVAKAVAARENYKIDSNQELRALGLANVAAAFFSGFPVAGSFSRTAVQYHSGGRTQGASIMTALMILLVLLFLTPLFYYLPGAALSAVILSAVWKLINLREARRIFRVRTSDGIAMLVTFCLTLAIGVEEGILGGAVFALLAYLRRTAYPRISELAYVAREDAFLGRDSYPEGVAFNDVLIVRVDARLYFANISFLEDWLLEATSKREDLELLVLDCRGVNGIDVTALEGLETLIDEYRERGIEVLLTHVKPQVQGRLVRAGWTERYPGIDRHQTTRDAMDEYKRGALPGV